MFHLTSLTSPCLLSQPAAIVRVERARRERMDVRWLVGCDGVISGCF